MHYGHRHQSSTLFEPHLGTHRLAENSIAPRQYEGGADIGMASKRHFGGWREDTNVSRVSWVHWRKYKSRLRVAELGSDALHKRHVQATRVRDNGQRIPAETGRCKDVHNLVGNRSHGLPQAHLARY